MTNTQQEEAEKKESKIEIKLQIPYVVPTLHEHRTAADTYLQYQCA